jgi:hypothetical protein
MIGFFRPVVPITWHLGTHKRKSDSVATLNHNLLHEKKTAINVQMVLSLQSGLRSIRQRILELAASGKSQRKPEKNYVREFELQSQKEIKGSYKKYRSFSMLHKHFPEK